MHAQNRQKMCGIRVWHKANFAAFSTSWRTATKSNPGSAAQTLDCFAFGSQ
jgi:hypothetical protein